MSDSPSVIYVGETGFDSDVKSRYVVVPNDGDADGLKQRVRACLTWLTNAEPPDESEEPRSPEGSEGSENPEDEAGIVEFECEWNEVLEELMLAICSRCEYTTVEIEDKHIDPSFRDAYYYHYSRRLCDLPRFCVRLTFHDGILDSVGRAIGETRHIGSCVLSPLATEKVGRTLIDPEYLLEEDAKVRLSDFETTAHGRRRIVSAFPYRSQDGVVTSCAEITLLNLMCYYSNEYSDYAVTLPSEILGIAQRYSHERVTPTRGMTYFDLSRILTERGFYPRLYNVDAMPSIAFSGYTRAAMFRHILHWYVCSGIPVAVNTASDVENEEGHSLLCIGYVPDKLDIEEMRKAAEPRAYRLSSSNDGKEQVCTLMHSADFGCRYVVIDDGQSPYSIRDYDQLSKYPRMRNENFVVALHRGMALDALAAHDAFIAILSHEKIGLFKWGKEVVEDGSEVVMRMFMASSRRFKRARVENSSEMMSEFYSNITYPHFVWVAELYLLDDYAAGNPAFGEVVLDGTVGSVIDPVQTIVYMKYPKRFLFRDPNRVSENIGMNVTPEEGELWSDEDNEVQPFDDNLRDIHHRQRRCDVRGPEWRAE